MSITPSTLVKAPSGPGGIAGVTVQDEHRRVVPPTSAGLSVLHVAQPTVDGVANYLIELVADQVARGFVVAVASPADGPLAPRTRSAGAHHHVWVAGREPGLGLWREVRTLRRLVAALRPNIVHLHSSKAGLAGRLALRGRVPTVFQPHAWSFEAVEGLVRRAAVLWERAGARWAQALLCVSEAERRRGEQHGIRGSWCVVPNGVDLDVWPEASDEDRLAARARLGLSDGPLVACIGRLSRQKGQDVLVEAWSSVAPRVPDARLVLVGEGPAEASLRRAAGASVDFAGHRDDVGDWLAAADVIAVPSRWEGMSLSMLEAMARGRSVVATDVAGAREAVGEEAGAIVPPDDAGALADALAERLLRPELAATEGGAARRRAERSHDRRRTAEAVAALYEELVAPR
jgi:glycosyltransferase involved in cell wall biosynthesis